LIEIFLNTLRKERILTGEISALACDFTWAVSCILTKSLVARIHPLTLNLLGGFGGEGIKIKLPEGKELKRKGAI